MTHTPQTGQPSPEKESFGALVATILGQVSTLVRGEMELAQVQLKEKVTKLGLGGALLAVAGVLALYMFGLLLFAAVQAFALIIPQWAAFLAVAGILLVIIAVLAVVGGAELKKSNEVKVDPAAGIKASTDAAKKGFKNE